jgi:nicotinate-nucleotide adenylyltransferase
MQPVGILGGTFDPIHKGHIKLAQEACSQLDLKQVRLVPLNIPAHRAAPSASANDRKTMIEQAITDDERLVIDCRELEKPEVSYTINTLKSLREELPDTSLCLIVGQDAFTQIDSWHQWESLLDFAHIVVASRPGKHETINTTLEKWINQHVTNDITMLQKKTAGYIYFMEIPLLPVSSSEIRSFIRQGQLKEDWLDNTTINYIKKNHLYQDTV